MERYSVTWPGNGQLCWCSVCHLELDTSEEEWTFCSEIADWVHDGFELVLSTHEAFGVTTLAWLMGPWGQVSGRPVAGNFIRFSWLAKDVNGCRSNISPSRMESSFITAWLWPVKHSHESGYWEHLSDINQHVSHLPLSDLISLRAFHLVEHCNVMRSRAEHGPLAITHSSEPFTQTGQCNPSLRHSN